MTFWAAAQTAPATPRPTPLRVEHLHELSGSQTKQLKHCKQNLVRALRDLEAIGAIQAFEIRDDLVHVRTTPPKPQERGPCKRGS